MPFIKIDPDVKLAVSAVHGVEFSVHELESSKPDAARILADADTRMFKRGWDRVVMVRDGAEAVAVYAQITPGSDIKVSVLVLEGRQMVAVTGHGKLEPLFELAMKKARDEGLLDRSDRK
jgi:hypothetical protein